MSLDSCLVELRHVRAEMNGISPKLSVYHKLKEREKELLTLIGKDPLQHFQNKTAAGLEKLHKLRCPMQGCPNVRRERPVKDAHGFPKRSALCDFHMQAEANRRIALNRIQQSNAQKRS